MEEILMIKADNEEYITKYEYSYIVSSGNIIRIINDENIMVNFKTEILILIIQIYQQIIIKLQLNN